MMAYPTVAAPYGFNPVNLIGGQVYTGSTREFPIAYNYGTGIFHGDYVQLSSGYTTILANTIAGNAAVGVFLGCSFTDPVTKQKRYSQYYPANTLAGDIVAVVADDPDLIMKAAVVTAAGTATIASASSLLVGQNMAGNTSTGSTSTGNSAGGVVAGSSSTGNFRVLALAPEGQIKSSATYVSGTDTTTLTVSGLTVGQVIPVGTDVFQSVNGQLQFTGSVVSTAATVSSATSQALTVTASTATIASTNPLVLVQTPEVYVKATFGAHRYYVA
jgi:hypothetical protein